jgi:hypothetical protein
MEKKAQVNFNIGIITGVILLLIQISALVRTIMLFSPNKYLLSL